MLMYEMKFIKCIFIRKVLQHILSYGSVLFILFVLCSCQEQEDVIINDTKIIAHCGFWNTSGSARNSISSLINAQNLGVYGSEFDVMVTSDGVPIINHDNSIEGKIVRNTAYEPFKDSKLENGEPLPTLEEYLTVGGKNRNLKLILEIKSSSKNDTNIIVGIVNKFGLAEQVEYLSFSLDVCLEIHRLKPAAKVSYLKGDLPPVKVKEFGLTGISYDYNILLNNMHWIKEAKELGLTTNVWIVNTPKLMNTFIREGIDFITTDYPTLWE